MTNTQTVVEGDNAFRGLDLRSAPNELGAGWLAGASNLRLVNGRVQPRGGVRFIAPPDPGGSGGMPAGPFFHAAVYRPVDGGDRIALACGRQIVLFNPTTGQLETSANFIYPPGVVVDDTINADGSQTWPALDWVQAGTDSAGNHQAYLLRGVGATALKFRYVDAMQELTAYDFGSGGTPQALHFPPAKFAIFYQDRLAAATDDSQVSVSDYLDFTTWSNLLQFNVAKGGGDYLVAAVPFQGDKVLILGRKSVWLAYFSPATTGTGWDTGLSGTQSYLRVLTTQFGCIARRSVVEVGGSILFLSDRGIVALDATLDLNLVASSESLSAPLQPVMDRLNANAATSACAVALRERVYVALPLLSETLEVTEMSVSGSGGTRTVRFDCDNPDNQIQAGDTVQVSGLDGALYWLNGNKLVTVATATSVSITTGVTAFDTFQPVGVTLTGTTDRPNVIVVWNTVNRAWESVDELPGSLRADYLLVADHGARKEVWIVDRQYGPALFESGALDMDGTYPAEGWKSLADNLTLPFALTAPNYNGTAVQASLTSRTYTWGDVTKAKRMRQGRIRLRLRPTDMATVTVSARTPADETLLQSVTVLGAEADDTVRLPLGARVIEAGVTVDFQEGAAALEQIAVEALMDVPEQSNA